jgi:hypothetical protein
MSAPRLSAALLIFVLCAWRPSRVAEAEAKGDVAWLDANGSADAIAALGRVADNDSRGVELLKKRASFDTNAYIAAWLAAKQELHAAWRTTTHAAWSS